MPPEPPAQQSPLKPLVAFDPDLLRTNLPKALRPICAVTGWNKQRRLWQQLQDRRQPRQFLE
jgi:hypothetical protein